MYFINNALISSLLFCGVNSFFTPLCILNVHGNRKVSTKTFAFRKYPISRYEREHFLKKLNSKNISTQTDGILGLLNPDEDDDDLFPGNQILSMNQTHVGGIRIVIDRGSMNEMMNTMNNMNPSFDDDDLRQRPQSYGNRESTKNPKSKNFEVIKKSQYNFSDIGGYDNIKSELQQCVDILKNYTKYTKFNVRIPRGLIFEGPPGNGKTLLAKALAGEAGVGFIPVSGSEFQEMYVGVGSSRVRELFKLAKDNSPCIIFIDEIDALGRKRSGDGEASAGERDSTLNELLVAMDGFKNNTGVFIVAATNRVDLLDPALIRPGRIDKRIYIGLPDKKTRESIVKIHIRGKPYDETVSIVDIIEVTNGLSAAQIENLLNEAMLNALREDRERFSSTDVDMVMNKIMVGWQPTEHQFSNNMIDNIAIHEMGHAIVGILSKHHSKMTKVVINLSAPRSPAYTIFEAASSSMYTRESLFEHLMILLAGRIAEEVFFGKISVSSGAINDFEEALKLAQQMIVYYGMGKQLIYPSNSDKYKEIIDNEVLSLLDQAYEYTEYLIMNSKELILEGSTILKRDKILTADTLMNVINLKYKNILDLKMHP